MTLANHFRRVLLALVLLPLLAITTTPGNVSAQSTPRYAKLISLECITTEDSTGADELYLKAAGSTVWTGNLNDGQTANLSQLASIRFYNSLELKLYDDDWPDSDDLLGTKTVYSTDAGWGNLELYFTDDGAQYKLTYYVY